VESQRKAEANRIIVKIDDFKGRNQRLPGSLSEIGIVENEEGPIYYKKINDTNYEIWFGRELGESTTYRSATHQWEH